MAIKITDTVIMREHALEIFRAGVNAVDPEEVIYRHISVDGGTFTVDDNRLALDDFKRIIVVGAGKATAPMARAVEALLGDRISTGAIVVKEGHGLPLERVAVYEGGHPVPNDAGVIGTDKILSLVGSAGKDDLVLCLISGGGSALLVAPADGLVLKDKQETTKLLLACGASIHEINTIRKHLSRAKGGQLARLAEPAVVISLILSDVVGDDLDVIASGPTVPDSSTFEDAWHILKGYAIWNRVPLSVQRHIAQGVAGEVPETPKAGDDIFKKCDWVLVGTNLQALEAASLKAGQLGYHSLILSSKVEGEAREVAKAFAAVAREIHSSQQPLKPPACVLCGGETTVTLQGDGRGGRNQEFALAAAMAIKGMPATVLLCGGTDGTDGPTDAAGAIIDGNTVAAAQSKGLDPADYLRRNDAYHFFKQLDDLIITGPTRTNVMDIYLLLVGTSSGR